MYINKVKVEVEKSQKNEKLTIHPVFRRLEMKRSPVRLLIRQRRNSVGSNMVQVKKKYYKEYNSFPHY